MKKILNNESGFTLVEIMIAAGITMVAALAVASIFVTMNNEQVKTKKKAELFNTQQQLSYDLKYKSL